MTKNGTDKYTIWVFYKEKKRDKKMIPHTFEKSNQGQFQYSVVLPKKLCSDYVKYHGDGHIELL